MNTFDFAYPEYFWLILLLPVCFFLKKKYCCHGAMKFSSVAIVKKISQRQRLISQKLIMLFRNSALICMIFALARPRIANVLDDDTTNGIDIVLAVDISTSMMALDLWKNDNMKTRLDVAKDVIIDFIKKRPHDRIGLVAFAGEPYLVSPLTMNHAWLVQNLERLKAGYIEDGTAIGSAIAMCANRLRDVGARSKIIIFLTDGCNNAGEIAPKIAAEAANQFGIKIYSIGVGKDGVVPVLQVDRSGNVVKNLHGAPIIMHASIPVDINMLTDIANITNGECFRATSEHMLSEIYSKIDNLEKHEISVRSYCEYDEKFSLFLLPAICLFALEILLRNTVGRRIP